MYYKILINIIYLKIFYLYFMLNTKKEKLKK